MGDQEPAAAAPAAAVADAVGAWRGEDGVGMRRASAGPAPRAPPPRRRWWFAAPAAEAAPPEIGGVSSGGAEEDAVGGSEADRARAPEGQTAFGRPSFGPLPQPPRKKRWYFGTTHGAVTSPHAACGGGNKAGEDSGEAHVVSARARLLRTRRERVFPPYRVPKKPLMNLFS